MNFSFLTQFEHFYQEVTSHMKQMLHINDNKSLIKKTSMHLWKYDQTLLNKKNTDTTSLIFEPEFNLFYSGKGY